MKTSERLIIAKVEKFTLFKLPSNPAEVSGFCGTFALEPPLRERERSTVLKVSEEEPGASGEGTDLHCGGGTPKVNLRGVAYREGGETHRFSRPKRGEGAEALSFVFAPVFVLAPQ